MDVPVRSFRLAASLLLVTSCGGTQAVSAAPIQDGSSDAFFAVVLDGGPQDGGQDGAVMAADAFAESGCVSPAFEGGAGPIPVSDAAPTIVATDAGYAWAFAVDTTTAYWTDESADRVMSAPLAGGSAQVVADTGTPGPMGIALDDAYVYWVSHGGQRILRCPKGASHCTPYVVGAPLGSIVRLALDAWSAYTLDSSRVLACAKTGCRNNPTVIASGLGTPTDLAVDGVNVYWFNYPPTPVGHTQTPAQLLKCPVSGCVGAPTVLASDPDPVGIAVDGRSVYWVSQYFQGGPTAAVLKCAACGCGGKPDVILPAGVVANYGALATDGAGVFFTDGAQTASGRLVACPVDGCVGAPTELSAGLDYPGPIALGIGTAVVRTRWQVLAIPK